MVCGELWKFDARGEMPSGQSGVVERVRGPEGCEARFIRTVIPGLKSGRLAALRGFYREFAVSSSFTIDARR